MNKTLFLALCVFSLASIAVAQEDKPRDEHRTVTTVLDHSIQGCEREFTSAAEAMPEDKYSYAPSNGEFKGVRNFGQQIKHVAAVNYEYGGAILGEKPSEVNDEDGPAAVKTKAEILKYLKESFQYVHKAIATINQQNEVEPVKSPFGVGTITRLGVAVSVCPHVIDHYGQMVEYLRSNGIVPPASR
ncbi:MAG TPA: DinB family protein [Candidatus Sulfotelmatobacter sp.]|nr:DinB family protein [Candidatus Sulfotelmatobacter sp.]